MDLNLGKDDSSILCIETSEVWISVYIDSIEYRLGLSISGRRRLLCKAWLAYRSCMCRQKLSLVSTGPDVKPNRHTNDTSGLNKPSTALSGPNLNVREPLTTPVRAGCRGFYGGLGGVRKPGVAWGWPGGGLGWSLDRPGPRDRNPTGRPIRGLRQVMYERGSVTI